MTTNPVSPTATALTAAIRSGDASASEVVDSTLSAIAARDPTYGAFTDILALRARTRAKRIDDMRAAGQPLGPLAGVPFAVKNLYDIAGVTTRAGSKINRDNAPASADATAITRLEAAGAILVGACNMDEYAYGFTGENAHDGPSRNPADTTRMTGGSSGGSAAAVASGLVAFALGSDTNGSIRVPASLCGLYGLKPTYGRLSRAGTFPFVASLDTIGPLARSLADLATIYDVLQGRDRRDPVCQPPADDVQGSPQGGPSTPWRMAAADGYFLQGASPEVAAAFTAFLSACRIEERVAIPQAQHARAAALVITASEGGAFHLERLQTRAADFDPDTRDRLIAGAMLPAAWITRAQRFRRWFNAEMMAVFETVDVIVTLATPITAPLLGQRTFITDGVERAIRPHLGLYTQPFSFIGLPVVTLPLPRRQGELPIGVQIISAPWKERAAFEVAGDLEKQLAGFL